MNVQSKSSQWLRESTQRRSVFGACAKSSQFLIEDFSLAGALLSAAVHPRTSLAARQHQSHDSRGAHCCTVINWFSSVELRWPWLFGGRLRQRDPSALFSSPSSAVGAQALALELVPHPMVATLTTNCYLAVASVSSLQSSCCGLETDM